MNKKTIMALLLPIVLILFFIAIIFELIRELFMLPCRWVHDNIIKDIEDDNN